MDDRELLELAAKAAEIELFRWNTMLACYETSEGCWNPRADDGDALRLAVKLNLSIHQHQHGAGWVDVGPIKILTGGDAYAATRRAIVRAAAEIGRAMP